MSIQSIARSAFAAIKRTAPEAVVVVAYGGKSCNGLRDATIQGSSLTGDGNTGETTGIVRVDASELDMPSKGATFTVGGKTVFLSDNARMDSCAAILTLTYSETRPNTEGA